MTNTKYPSEETAQITKSGDSAKRLLMTSPEKIAFHREKMEMFLAGELIFPVTVEMDITTFCPRKCGDCPSTRSPEARRFALPDIDRFFGRLESQTKGLLLSGGEPTSSPDFAAFLKLARRRGFEEIAVVSNGANLDEEQTMEALMEDATVIRVSLYGWEDEVERKEGTVLRKIEALRNRIEACGSGLHIGVSALTDHGCVSELEGIATAAAAAGANWIYFHPLCTGWGTGHLNQAGQTGVPEEVCRLAENAANGFGIYHCPSRYRENRLSFSQYYSSHFLMVVGADGINYLGTETKYQKDYAIADTLGDLSQFPWQPERLSRIQSINHGNYPPLGGRHRGLLYNDYVEKLRKSGTLAAHTGAERYLYPHIL